jgi:hypothetical protein
MAVARGIGCGPPAQDAHDLQEGRARVLTKQSHKLDLLQTGRNTQPATLAVRIAYAYLAVLQAPKIDVVILATAGNILLPRVPMMHHKSGLQHRLRRHGMLTLR